MECYIIIRMELTCYNIHTYTNNSGSKKKLLIFTLPQKGTNCMI